MRRRGGHTGKKSVEAERRADRSVRGYGWLKSWLHAQQAGKGPLAEGGEQATPELPTPADLGRWMPRLFSESSREDRERILRTLVPLAGREAVPYLEDVLASPRSRLNEKRLALEKLRALGRPPDPASEENLQKALGFVESVPVMLGEAERTGAVPDALLRSFQDLLPPYPGIVLRELMQLRLEGVFRFLDSVLAVQGALWEEILEDLEESPLEEAARLLRSGYGKADKALQKKIRRVHHKRIVRALPVVPLEGEKKEAAVWRPPVPPKPAGFISMPEAGGDRMVWLIRPNVPKGMLMFVGLLQDERGLVKFVVSDFSRKELERYRASLLESRESTVVECDAGFCAWLLDEARQKGGPEDAEEAEACTAFRPLLKELVPPQSPRAPIYAVFADSLDEVAAGDPLGESARLLNEPLLSNWAMEAGRVRPHLEKLEEISKSRIIVHPLQKRERLDAYYRDTTREILADPTCRTAWRRRIEDAAWVFYKKGLSGQARRLASLSRYLEDPQRDASRVAFFVELVRKGLEEKLQEQKREERELPSLILKPS